MIDLNFGHGVRELRLCTTDNPDQIIADTITPENSTSFLEQIREAAGDAKAAMDARLLSDPRSPTSAKSPLELKSPRSETRSRSDSGGTELRPTGDPSDTRHERPAAAADRKHVVTYEVMKKLIEQVLVNSGYYEMI